MICLAIYVWYLFFKISYMYIKKSTLLNIHVQHSYIIIYLIFLFERSVYLFEQIWETLTQLCAKFSCWFSGSGGKSAGETVKRAEIKVDYKILLCFSSHELKSSLDNRHLYKPKTLYQAYYRYYNIILE